MEVKQIRAGQTVSVKRYEAGGDTLGQILQNKTGYKITGTMTNTLTGDCIMVSVILFPVYTMEAFKLLVSLCSSFTRQCSVVTVVWVGF